MGTKPITVFDPAFGITDPIPAEEIGYCRVSTGRNQDPDFQIALMEKRGIPKENIFVDVMSGGKMSRPAFDLALKELRPGFTLVIWKLDRLGRDAKGLLELLDWFNDEGFNLVSLTEQIDTKTPMGKAFYGMLAVFAQFERDVDAERTKAGMARRKERGYQVGRKSEITAKQFADMERRLLTTRETIGEIAGRIKVRGKHISKSLVNHYFPGWRIKTKAQRAKYRRLHPLPSDRAAK